MYLLRPFLIGTLLLALAGLFTAPSAHAAAGPATTTTNAPAAVAVSNALPVSVFEDSMTAGKDPFFPHSRRRNAEASAAAAGNSADISSLILQGVSGGPGRPLATINNQTFKPGEEGEVITPNGRMRIRCEEIRGDVVTISLGAQRLELKLPQR